MKKKYSIKQNHVPAILSLLTIILALIWFGTLYFVNANKNDDDSINHLRNQKITFEIHKPVEVSNLTVPEPITPITPSSEISFIVEAESLLVLKNAQKFSKLNPIFVLNPLNQDFNEQVKFANEESLPFFVKMQFLKTSSKEEFAISANMDEKTIIESVNKIKKKLGNNLIGFINLGDDISEEILVAFSYFIKALKEDNLTLIYGIHNKTSVIESDNEAMFSVEAIDELIDYRQGAISEAISLASNLKALTNNKMRTLIYTNIADVSHSEHLNLIIENLLTDKVNVTRANFLPKAHFKPASENANE